MVSVPVLSNATVRTRDNSSSAPPPLTTMPDLAARLIPATNAIGAASSSGHGVATTRTSAKRTGSPRNAHAAPAIAKATAVNGTAYRSARRTIGARLSAADSTR